MLGAGARAVRRDTCILYDGPLPRAGRYESSVWAWMGTKGLPTLCWRTYDRAGRPLDSASVAARTVVDFFGNWGRAALALPVRWPGQRVRVYCEGQRYLIDAFELRPDTVTVWRRVGGVLLRNNYPLLPPPGPLPVVSPAVGSVAPVLAAPAGARP
jgi:hypothetical protein